MALKSLAAFHFLYPAWLLAIPPLVSFALWRHWKARRAGRWGEIVAADLLEALRLEEEGRRRSPWLTLALAWTLGALALAGPAWRRVPSAAYREPADWVVVLDLSPSMNAADLPPNRVTRAHYLIEDLLRAARDARIALIVFSGDAHTVVPLTDDVATIRSLLDPLVPSIMPQPGHALAPALDQAASLLQQAGSRNGHVIVLADGFDDPARAFAAAQRLRSLGATVDAVGVGTVAGAPEPGGDGFVRDASGKLELTKLHVDRLRQLAATGGGSYWSVDSSRGLIDRLEAARLNPLVHARIDPGARVAAWRNEGYWLLLPLLLVAATLARRGWV